MNKKTGTIFKTILIIILIVLLIVMMVQLFSKGKEPIEYQFSQLEQLLTEGVDGKLAAELRYVGTNGVVILFKDSTLKPGQFPEKYDAFMFVGSRDSFLDKMQELIEKHNVGDEPKITAKYGIANATQKTSWVSYIFPAISIVLMGILLFFLFKQMSGGGGKAMSFGKSKAQITSGVKVRFTDVAGAEEEKAELEEIVDFLKEPKRFTDLGARIPKGVLLVGPPGTGKTLFAKAVAGEANVPFFSISGSDFVEMFVGTGAARVRDLFEQAKKNMPCIIFIDEIDAVGRQRGAGMGGGNDEREQTLNQLLVQMDGFDKNDGIIIMAATNRADVLDPALLRPGRFDRQIYVNIPDVKGREEIFKVHSRNKPLSPDVSFKILARMTSGFSGADIENLLNEASILAVRAGRKIIIMEDVLEGINKVIAGPQKRSRIITETDKRITAYHEAGHAIIAKVLDNCDEVQEVSIIPRGMAAGYTLTRPETDDSHVTCRKLNDMIAMMLGGRAAEEIVIHDISTGASNDIQRASGIARSMVTEWGMSKTLGNIFLGGSGEVFLGRDYGQHNTYSENMAGVIDDEIKKIIDANYEIALKLLRENRTILDNMVKVLFEKETIYTDEVNMLFEGKSAEEICKYIDERIARSEALKQKAQPKIVPQNATTAQITADKVFTLDNSAVAKPKVEEFVDFDLDKSNNADKVSSEKVAEVAIEIIPEDNDTDKKVSDSGDIESKS